MIRVLKNHSWYYAILAGILLSGFLFFLSFSANPQSQMMVVMMTSLSYVGFALFHHHLNNDLSAKVVLEYVLIAALGISLVFFYLT